MLPLCASRGRLVFLASSLPPPSPHDGGIDTPGCEAQRHQRLLRRRRRYVIAPNDRATLLPASSLFHPLSCQQFRETRTHAIGYERCRKSRMCTSPPRRQRSSNSAIPFGDNLKPTFSKLADGPRKLLATSLLSLRHGFALKLKWVRKVLAIQYFRCSDGNNLCLDRGTRYESHCSYEHELAW